MTLTSEGAGQWGRGCFVTTHWSVVLAAGDGDPVRAKHALARLCQAYWQPLYAYVRQRGYSARSSFAILGLSGGELLNTFRCASIRRSLGGWEYLSDCVACASND